MTWTTQYSDIPFKDVGRDRDGADCYGVPRLVLLEQCNILLPLRANYKDTTPDEPLRDYVEDGIDESWIEIPKGEEKEFDIILLRIMGLPIHMGIITDIPFHMLHTVEGAGVTVEDYRKGKWKVPGKIIGFYRHRELCKS